MSLVDDAVAIIVMCGRYELRDEKVDGITQIYLPLCPLFLAPLRPPVVRRDDERRPKELTMALRRPPTRIELKADDVEDYDKPIRTVWRWVKRAQVSDLSVEDDEVAVETRLFTQWLFSSEG
ncbi:predicted protein [Thalassiosira pseudonana CCMP1335]|uniref:Anaphase-promoting complex subunit CDC26 n=1 Tax=Thalassiosira pseudonana TaxID=35128 RepID=B8LDN0_THAPS|nr:predicted protein [Thalassiosira pseudonana CCMP1335]EED86575.1 predicted protein [Thalassiosira pseudonana CCMP1335]